MSMSVSSPSRDRAVEEGVADAPADEVALVAGVGRAGARAAARATSASSSGWRRDGIAVIDTILVGSARSPSETMARHPRARAHAPVPSPEWTARSPARGSAAMRPRSPCSPSTPGSPWCGSIRSDTPGRGAGVLCAHPCRPAVPAPRLDPPRPARRGVAALDRRARGDDAREPQTASGTGARPAPASPPARVCPSTAPSPPRSPRYPRRSARPRSPRRSSPRS